MNNKFYTQSFIDLKLDTSHIQDEYRLGVILSNPKARNAITDGMIQSLVEVLKHADADPQIRVIYLTGDGDAFCAGGDIKAMADKSGMFAGESNELRGRYKQGIQQIPLAIEAMQTPLVAMVNGVAVGAGCDMVAMCDLRIGSSTSSFAETFSKMALVPGDGGTYFLSRTVGYAKAMEMYLTADSYDAEAALKMNLLNRVVVPANLHAETMKYCQKIAQNSPIALQMTKQALKAARLDELRAHLETLAAFQGITQRTRDHEEALRAFKEKRPPAFQGF